MKSSRIFHDTRLDKEYDRLVSRMVYSGSGVSNRACSKSSDKKSAYRFINNENVTVSAISADLIRQTVSIVQALGVKDVLIAQDTMEIVREGIVKRLGKKGDPILECAHTNKGMRSIRP